MRLFKIRASQLSKIMGNSKKAGELSQTCKSYLQEWYSDDREEIHSKYLDKGSMCEPEAIQFMAQVLEYGIAEKNQVQFENEYITGSPDVILNDTVVDIKCPWNKKTFQSNVEGIDSDYEWQGRAYMILTGAKRFILFYALMDTDESVNFGTEVIYSDIPDNERWLAYQIEADETTYHAIADRVEMCREWLSQYDELVRSKVGKINF